MTWCVYGHQTAASRCGCFAAVVGNSTGANGDSTMFVVRRCVQCSFGTSEHTTFRSQPHSRVSVALAYDPRNCFTRRSRACSRSASAEQRRNLL